MAVPYKLNYFEIETGIDSTSTLIHTGDLTATKIKKYLATSNDILLGDGTTTPLSGLQPSGNYITSLIGEATGSGAGAASVTLTNSAVIGKVLTGLSVTGGAVVSTDSILTAFGKIQNQINGKQDPISLTTTGSSGASTFISNTLNVPTYTLSGLGGVPTTRQLTINGTAYDLSADRSWSVGTVTSVGLTMPSAFNVANSPITSSGTLAVTAAGVASQYIRGDGTLSDFPTNGGGGSSVSYYLNGSVSQGTISGNAYKEMNKTPVIGTGTDFTIGADGYIAQFITDANDPASLLIPSGNWNVEMYFSASSSGGTPSFYVELYKYDGATFTLLGSSATTPEGITNGTAIDIYYTSLAVPETVLTLTDRLAIRVYVTASGRTITLHTEDNHLSEIITTFSNGLTALNGLTKQVQYFAVGSTGTDFAISSSVDTHTFNLPSASATARGLVTTGTQTFAGAKTLTSTLTATAATFSSIIPLVFSSATNIDFHQLNSGTIRFIDNTAVSVNLSVTNSGDLATRGTATIGSIGALGSSATTFLTNTAGLIQSRTAAEVRSDIGAGTGSGTVTSVAAITLGTTGTDLSSTVANGTTTPVITLNVPDASATARGVVTTGIQTFAGDKTFSSIITGNGGFQSSASTIIASTYSGTGSNGLTLQNGGGQFLAGMDTNTGGGTGSNYAGYINIPSTRDFYIQATAIKYFKITNTTGAITLSSLTNGLVKSTSGVLSNATANTDYLPVASPTFTGTITGGAFSGTSATFSGNVIFDTTDRGIVSNTTDGSDNKFVFINGGGARGSDRGAGVNFFGNEATGTGRIDMQAGDVTGGVINLVTQGLNRLTVNRDGTTTLTQALSGTSATFSSTITTGAPSGGTAKPFKIGNVATVTPTLQNRTIEIEIDGTTYYLTAKTTND